MAKTDNAAAIAAFKAKNPGQKLPSTEGGGVAHGTMKLKETQQEKPEEEPTRVIEDKEFPVLPYAQGTISAVMLPMSMADVVDYTTYASELYEVTQGTEEVDPTATWQRNLNEKRAAKEIGPYLLNDLHFFPALICVPCSDNVSLEHDKLVLSAESLAVLDGQHRRAGIASLLAEVGPDSDFAKEQVPVIVITSDLDIDGKQQIFSDINRSPKVVSKALNILYDHRDPYAVIAHSIAKDMGQVVDLTRTVPTPKSSNACSLSNIYNLVVNFSALRTKGQKPVRRDGLTDQLVSAVVKGMIEALPSYDRLKAGHDTYNAVRKSYICYSSTLFQAMGNAAMHLTMGVEPEAMADLCVKLVAGTNWSYGNPIWAAKGIITQNEKGDWSVGTRSEHISKASGELELMWSELKGGLQS